MRGCGKDLCEIVTFSLLHFQCNCYFLSFSTAENPTILTEAQKSITRLLTAMKSGFSSEISHSSNIHRMEALPKVLLFQICEYLLPIDLQAGLILVNKKLHLVVTAFLQEFEPYLSQFLGDLPFLSSLAIAKVLPVLLQATVPVSAILSLAATYTDGGIFNNTMRFWAQNMFEYTGCVYTSVATENVTVAGAYVSGCQDRAQFSSRLNEDLVILLGDSGWQIPQKYQGSFVVADCFMNGQAGKRGTEYAFQDSNVGGQSEGPVLRTGRLQYRGISVFTDEVASPAGYALATTIGVARPAFATCPVHTLLICTKLQCSSPDLSLYHSLSSLEEVTKRSSSLPPIHSQCDSGPYSYVQFSALEGPLLWLQFKDAEVNQVEVEVQPRLLKQAEVLLIDMEDRRLEYRRMEQGIDVTYVLFEGREISTRVHDITKLPS